MLSGEALAQTSCPQAVKLVSFHGPKDHGEPATEACKNIVSLGSVGNADLAAVPCSVLDLAANFAQNIHLPPFLYRAMLLSSSDCTVYIPA